MMTTQMAALQKAMEQTADIRFVTFTVDPENDVPHILASYALHHGAGPRWRFLTGTKEDIWKLSREGFHLGVDDNGTVEEPIAHSIRFVLVDRHNTIRGYYDATDEAAMARLREDVVKLQRSN
jgi:protein SCO1/2